MTNTPELLLPDDFDDYAWEVESKGVFSGVVQLAGRSIVVTFYDARRLAQDIEEDLSLDGYSILGYVVVVSKLTADAIKSATTHLDPALFN